MEKKMAWMPCVVMTHTRSHRTNRWCVDVELGSSAIRPTAESTRIGRIGLIVNATTKMPVVTNPMVSEVVVNAVVNSMMPKMLGIRLGNPS